MSNREVKLRGMAKFTHFSPMMVPLIFSALGIVLPLFSHGGKDLTMFVVVGIPATILVFWWLKSLLRYREIQTSFGAAENHNAVLALAHQKGWKVCVHRPGEFLQMSTQGFPKTMRSWGELVSVEFSGGLVFVNSICDPNKRASVTAYGRNTENVQAVADAVRGPNHTAEPVSPSLAGSP